MPHPNFEKILQELRELHAEKDTEYSGTEPLSNYRTAEEWGDPAWKSSLLRAEEKRKRLQNQWKSGKELRRDDWLDLCAHWINTLVLWEEGKAATRQPKCWSHYTCGKAEFFHLVTSRKCGWLCPDCGFTCK